MATDLDRFARSVAARAPDLDSQEAILQASDAVLGELAAYVSGPAAERLGSELPPELRSSVRNASPTAEGGESSDFYAAVAAREGTQSDVAAEHAQAVLRAIAETVDAEPVRAVRDQLTPELRELLAEEREDDTSQLMSSGPVDPDAPKLAGPERPIDR